MSSIILGVVAVTVIATNVLAGFLWLRLSRYTEKKHKSTVAELEAAIKSSKAAIEASQATIGQLQATVQEKDTTIERTRLLMEIVEKYPHLLAAEQQLKQAEEKSLQEIKQTLERAKFIPGLDRLDHIKDLGDQGSRAFAAVGDLVRMFQDRGSPPSVRWHILSALRKIDPERTAKLIEENASRDKHSSIRAYSAYLRGQLPGAGVALTQTEQSDALMMREDGVGPVYSYVLLKAPSISEAKVFPELRALPYSETYGVIEAGVVQGEYDAVLKIIAPDIRRFNRFVMDRIQSIQGVETTRTFIVINEPRYFHWVRKEREGYGINAATSWVLIRVPTLQSGGVVICAEEIPGVREAATVYGEADVIVKIQARSEEARPEEAQDKTMSELRKIPYVASTETHRVITPIRDYYFSRHDGFKWDSSLLV